MNVELRLLFLLIFSITIYGCNDSISNNMPESKSTLVAKNRELTKKEVYEIQMEEKGFSLSQLGRCSDALEDTLHEMREVYN